MCKPSDTGLLRFFLIHIQIYLAFQDIKHVARFNFCFFLITSLIFVEWYHNCFLGELYHNEEFGSYFDNFFIYIFLRKAKCFLFYF